MENIKNEDVQLDMSAFQEEVKVEVKPTKRKSKKKVEGIGDVIKVVTNAIGLETCGECEERRKKLNKMFPFTKTAKELSDEDVEFVNSLDKQIPAEVRGRFEQLVRDTFNEKFVACNCPSKYRHALDRLKTLVGYQKQIKDA